VPLLTSTPAVNEFVPDNKEREPDPALLKGPVPLIVPDKVKAFPPSLKELVPFNVIEFERETLAVARKDVPEAKLIGPEPKELELPIWTLPALIVVPPLYEFSLGSIRIPLFDFVREPPPEIVPYFRYH
jgi:hypothetical protein